MTRTTQPLIKTYKATPEQSAIELITAQAAGELSNALRGFDNPEITRTFTAYRQIYQDAAAIYREAINSGALSSVHPSTALVNWIKAAPDQDARRYRQGIAFVITGNLYSPK